MKLSACITGNSQQQHWKRCLESIRGYVDEIIITGSRGASRDYAAQFGATIYPFTWTGDIVAARNASIAPATGDWILLLNCDEFLRAGDGDRLRMACQNAQDKSDIQALQVSAATFTTEKADNLFDGGIDNGNCVVSLSTRLFRRSANLCYEAPIFEEPVVSATKEAPKTLVAPLVMLYRDATLGAAELIQLSKQRVASYPDHPSSYLLRGQQYKNVDRPLRMLLDYETAFDLRYKTPELSAGAIPNLPDRYPAALFDSGMIWAKLGDCPRAVDRFVSALQAQQSVHSAGFDEHLALRELVAYSTCLSDQDTIATLSQFAPDLSALTKLVNILRTQRPDSIFLHFCELWHHQTHQRDINYITVQMITGEYAAAASALLVKYHSSHKDTYAAQALVAALLANKPRMVEHTENEAVDALLLTYAGRRTVEPYSDTYIEIAKLLLSVAPDAVATTRWLELGMDNPILTRKLGDLLGECRRFRRAIRYYKRAQLLYETPRPDIQKELAYCSYRAGVYTDVPDYIATSIAYGVNPVCFELLAYFTAKLHPEGRGKQTMLELVDIDD